MKEQGKTEFKGDFNEDEAELNEDYYNEVDNYYNEETQEGEAQDYDDE